MFFSLFIIILSFMHVSFIYILIFVKRLEQLMDECDINYYDCDYDYDY